MKRKTTFVERIPQLLRVTKWWCAGKWRQLTESSWKEHAIAASRGLIWGGLATIVISLGMFAFFTVLFEMDNEARDIARLQFNWGFGGGFGGLFLGVIPGISIEHKLTHPSNQ